MAFLADAMLGKLTRYLRMMGYDVEYAGDHDVETDNDLLRLAEQTDRRIITRDTEIASQTDATLLETLEIQDQLTELHDKGFNLQLTTPSRCSVCNAELRQTAEHPEHAPSEQRVWRCRECGKHYWKGSHWRDVEKTLEDIRGP